MQSRWSDQEAAEHMERFAPKHGEQLALRVYTSRLIGREPELVMHGGGNTSMKGHVTTLLGDRVEALFVKGSGWELDTIEPAGLPAMDLAHLRRLRGLDTLSDEEMVNQFRTHLFDSTAPNPSVESLLHAFLPHRFVDHTHADVALVLTNQPPDLAESFVREAFGPKWGVVPYIMPGLALGKLAAQVFERDPTVEGLVLMNHGLFSFADDARMSYERMIAAVDRAERFVRDRARPRRSAGKGTDGIPSASAALIGPSIRGALAVPGKESWRRVVLDFRTGEEILGLLAAPDMAELAARGPLTPDHVIRTKSTAFVVSANQIGSIGDAVSSYRASYDAYFEANAARASRRLEKLDPSPRVVLVPGVGLFGVGRTKQDARIAADIAEHTIRAKAVANAIGTYRALSERDLFDMEYWSLEQAKLGKAKEPALAGQVALVTGAAGAIGSAICRKLIEAGAHVVVTDLDPAVVARTVAELDPKQRGVAAGVAMDVTDAGAVARGFADACRLYGGIDIVVPNAGVAHVGAIDQLDEGAFRKVVDVNLMGTFHVVKEAATLLKRQGTGGNIILNSSKNVFGPGADFAAYSASKAGAHQLAKVAAIELASAGIRVNMINADAIFGDEKHPSGLWQHVGPARAKSRNLELSALPDYYRQRNLLKVSVTADHVANGVLFFASNQTPTTGASLPVDGGLVEAFPR